MATAKTSSLQQSNCLTKKWKQSYVPSYKGAKYDLALTQVTKSLQGANNATSLAQMSIKLMSNRVHRKADTVGAIMAQLSMKSTIKKWGNNAKLAITNKMKQLHWRILYQPKHWHDLSKMQKDQILESHIFVEYKRDGKIKASKVIVGDRQQDYITKEDVSSPTV